MENNLNQQLNHGETSNLENKIRKILLSSVRILMPLVGVIFAFYAYSLNTKYSEVSGFLIKFIAPLLLLPVLGLMLIWCLFQVKKGISGEPILSGKTNRQPFIFLGMLVFLFLSVFCVSLIIGIFYLFSI